MTTHKFEHPLNEKTRIYLRVESLLRQAHLASGFTDNHQYQLFFRALFDMVEIFEQLQLKSELAKDVEKQRLSYRHWLNVEGVDQSALTTLLNEIDVVHSQLMKAERFGQALKEDRFLSSIRQRFSLPGGSCCFDLPALHYWLHLPIERKKKDAQKWLDSLKPLSDALNLWLKLTRETGQFKAQIGRAGFFQSDADEANILRLHIPMNHGVYPMISGHKNRFAIKFMSFESGQACTQDVEFELAVCS
ncbi:Cell division factor that enhances FtsZ-ring assembly. Directly interacts with FtsZ and promotes bundling of FtsZ protofilaments [Vibrio sp. B1FLJ16]|uniref:cell division protein ZapD n=1 Tax=Vibrio sp. B1FLJ16 TaxID=2751178 RepID=UPI0015F75419|nr:cell division protein ZapD [Vibrio sp. B1FLJ16]CAD7810849.1 Cell division factor that enhances FtsZ-ring assembly. Directly interacts with FtsZ and promotes bundling of FtsZ protofilaments [Vibrio sp. B1FLJ16]CAE6913405.1 Cell division factor that enhances FtsZ-ring assembly. Directly interacts with FtsZ and promotes bundling of FtsZ protofilaments [Vibrio sp. B1FLJ16]